MENKNVFNSFLNCTRLPLSRIFLGSLFHRVCPAQANACRPKHSKFTFGTSRSNPPAERSDRRGAGWSSSAARYSGVPSYKALYTKCDKNIKFFLFVCCVSLIQSYSVYKIYFLVCSGMVGQCVFLLFTIVCEKATFCCKNKT